MTSTHISMKPLAVSLRGDQGSTALFACELPPQMSGTARVWATCGQRKRFPVKARIVSDETRATRKLLATVSLPALYSACTLHLIVADGKRLRFASCRIPAERFRGLAATEKDPENDFGYHDWFVAHRATPAELDEQRRSANTFASRPLISIVTPIYRTPRPFLKAFVNSILRQTYENFELVLVNVSGEWPEVDETLAGFNDERIRVIEAPNRTIPENTNVGIEAARGDYVGFVDHDDFIEPDAFYRYVEVINAHPNCDLLFCDEDLWDPDWDGGRFCGARFKPGWNPDLLATHNYVCHLLMASRWALERTQRSQADVNGAQDYDLTLKVSEVAREICPVPGILYHWRKHPGSTASNRSSKPYALEAGRKAVQAHLDRMGLPAEAEIGYAPFSYRVRYQAAAAHEVSIVLVDRERARLATRVGSAPALGGEVELIACGCNSLNDAAQLARGSLLVFLDDSIDVSGDAWLDEITRQLRQPATGCSAPLILDDERFVKSAGYVRGIDGVWRHSFTGHTLDDAGYMLMLDHAHDVSAVPLRCLAIRKGDLARIGGFDESLPGDWIAIDLCLRLRDAGLLTVTVPYAYVTVRGSCDDLDDPKRGAEMANRYPRLSDGDLYTSPLLDQRNNNFRLCP